mmetsp:Transcript_44831/g.128046  ORF Transcript_44831/g.128046 Transcript_44831/m.128046 type:complete len:389 (+) Transcript_44831:68-1234(+)
MACPLPGPEDNLPPRHGACHGHGLEPLGLADLPLEEGMVHRHAAVLHCGPFDPAGRCQGSAERRDGYCELHHAHVCLRFQHGPAALLDHQEPLRGHQGQTFCKGWLPEHPELPYKLAGRRELHPDNRPARDVRHGAHVPLHRRAGAGPGRGGGGVGEPLPRRLPRGRGPALPVLGGGHAGHGALLCAACGPHRLLPQGLGLRAPLQPAAQGGAALCWRPDLLHRHVLLLHRRAEAQERELQDNPRCRKVALPGCHEHVRRRPLCGARLGTRAADCRECLRVVHPHFPFEPPCRAAQLLLHVHVRGQHRLRPAEPRQHRRRRHGHVLGEALGRLRGFPAPGREAGVHRGRRRAARGHLGHGARRREPHDRGPDPALRRLLGTGSAVAGG